MLFKCSSNALQMLFKSRLSPLDFNIESGQDLFLVLNDNHTAIALRVRPIQFAVEFVRDLVFVSLIRLAQHHSNQEQVLAVNL